MTNLVSEPCSSAMAEGTRLKTLEDSIRQMNLRFEMQTQKTEAQTQKTESQLELIQQLLINFGKQNDEQQLWNRRNEERWTEFVEQMRDIRTRLDTLSPRSNESPADQNSTKPVGNLGNHENDAFNEILGSGSKDREIWNPTSHESPAPFKNEFEESSDVARKAHKGASIEDRDQEVTPNLAPRAPISRSQGCNDPTRSWGIGSRGGQEIDIKMASELLASQQLKVETPRQGLQFQSESSKVTPYPLTFVVVEEDSKELGGLDGVLGKGMETENAYKVFVNMASRRNMVFTVVFDPGGVYTQEFKLGEGVLLAQIVEENTWDLDILCKEISSLIVQGSQIANLDSNLGSSKSLQGTYSYWVFDPGISSLCRELNRVVLVLVLCQLDKMLMLNNMEVVGKRLQWDPGESCNWDLIWTAIEGMSCCHRWVFILTLHHQQWREEMLRAVPKSDDVVNRLMYKGHGIQEAWLRATCQLAINLN